MSWLEKMAEAGYYNRQFAPLAQVTTAGELPIGRYAGVGVAPANWGHRGVPDEFRKLCRNIRTGSPVWVERIFLDGGFVRISERKADGDYVLVSDFGSCLAALPPELPVKTWRFED